ncbi:MAG: methylmalonyl-CoA epimerase [Bacteroidota bacterium]
MNKIEHIGIAVKSIAESEKLFSLLLNKTPYKTEKVESEGVNTQFFMVGETKVELLESVKPGSAIAKFIEKKGEGVHHIAFAVDDINVEIQRLTDNGFELIHKTAKEGADNKMIAFLHPKSTNGVLVELCMEKK